MYEPAVFMMRMILHDWSDEYCVKILRRLRAAAGPSTQLVVIDSIMTYACEEPEAVNSIPGAKLAQPPFPLLPNYGAAGAFANFSDMQVRANKPSNFCIA